MNRDTIEGSWREVKGRIQARWGKLTNDEIDQIDGNYEMLCGKLQKAYGMSRDEADKMLKDLS